MKKYTRFSGHFDDHADVPVQCGAHADWHDIADKYAHIWLVHLIEKTVLKQTESKDPYQRFQDKMRVMLNFQQAAGMNNNNYYEKTANCVEITHNAGGIFYMPTLMDLEAQ